MAALVTLKRFDGLEREGLTPALDRSTGTSPQSASLIEGAESDLAPMPIQPSAEQEKTAELQRELQGKQDQLAEILRSLSTELQAAKVKITAQMGSVIADSTMALLPALLDKGFAQELSTTAVQIAGSVEPVQITLKVHPKDHEPVIDALQALTPKQPLTVEKDSSMISGSVRLSWPDGGAEIDQTALLKHATGLLEARIASLLSGKDHNEY